MGLTSLGALLHGHVEPEEAELLDFLQDQAGFSIAGGAAAFHGCRSTDVRAQQWTQSFGERIVFRSQQLVDRGRNLKPAEVAVLLEHAQPSQRDDGPPGQLNGIAFRGEHFVAPVQTYVFRHVYAGFKSREPGSVSGFYEISGS